MKRLDNQTFYDQDALAYDERWVTTGGTATERAQQAIVTQLCANWAGRDVVEIGCGTGRFSLQLAQLKVQLTLVDLAPQMLALAKAKLTQAGLATTVQEYINASIYELPLPTASVDCVVSLNVFNHLENLPLALAQCARILKPGGEFLFNYPNLYSYFWPMAWHINRTNSAVGQAIFSQWLKPAAVNQQLRAAGFTLEHCVGHVHVPRALEPFKLNFLLQQLDRLSRQHPLRSLAPVQFCFCRKVEATL